MGIKARAARGTLSTKLLVSAGLVLVSAGLAGMGAFALFTDTQTVDQATTSGTVTLNPVSTSGANNRLSISASNIAPTDSIQRAVNIKDTGNIDLADVKLTTTASPTSVLDTDATDGLQMVIDKCDVAWTEANSPRYTYTCSGTTSSVLATRPVIGANLTLNNLTLTAGSDNFLRVTLTFPSTAVNNKQNKASTINYSFTGTQRTAQAQ